jgi:hypothetical protein
MELALDLTPPESKHYRSWNERLRYVARYSQPEEIHVLLEQAHSMGVRAVMAVLDGRIEAALREHQLWRELDIWAVVPNMNAFIRDLTDRGLVGAAVTRFLRLTPSAMVATGMNALRELSLLARSDFSAGALWLAQMELAGAQSLRVHRVFLHPQLTEIALAGRVAGLFTEFAARVRDRGLEAGLVTNNPLAAADLLGERLAAFSVIVSPCNPRGYKMVPDRVTCERLLRAYCGQFWAREATAGGCVRWPNAMDHVRDLGLAGAIVDPKNLESRR